MDVLKCVEMVMDRADPGDVREFQDTADLDAYYCPFAVSNERGVIYWYSPITGEPVIVQRFVGHA